LFNAVESSGNYIFRQDTPPTVFRARVINYALGAFKVFIERLCRRNLKKGDLKFKGLMLFLIVESDWKATNTPSMPSSSPNTSNLIFEIAILFNAVESSGNYIFEQDTPHTVFMARVISYALGAYKVFYRKRCRRNFKRAHSIGN
jgi:hypothetical protein